MTASQRRMIQAIVKHTRADGWADWTDVYNEWDPQTIPPGLAGQAAQRVIEALVSRGLVECAVDKLRALNGEGRKP